MLHLFSIGQAEIPTIRKIAIAVALGLCATGCAHPESKIVGEFGVGVANVSAIVADAAALDTELDAKAKLINGGTLLAKGQVSFPPLPGRFIRGKSDQDWKVRIRALKGLAAYGKALTEINDPARASDAAAAASAVGEGITGLVKGSGSEKSKLYADKTAALAEIASDLFGIAIETYTAIEMRQAMEHAHPRVSELASLLKEDLADISLHLKVNQRRYETAVSDRLETFASDVRLSSAEKYDRYVSASAEYAAFDERRKAVDEGAKALDELVDAHKAILSSEDQKRAVSSFLSTVEGLAGQIKKLQDAEVAIKKLNESKSKS